jgi:hypothetical protein
MPALQVLVTTSILLSLGYLAAITLASVVSALRAGGRRDDAPDVDDALAESRLTMPVSIVIPVNRAKDAVGCLEQALELSYPEFEVIAVVDAPAPEIDALTIEWQLEPREFFYRRTIETAPVRRILRSLRDPRLMVVEKEPSDRTDAINCGMDLARYRYVAVVPPGIRFERSALLRAMAPVLRDPVTVVGIASPVERTIQSSAAETMGTRAERLRSIRALMSTRLFWSRRATTLAPTDGVVIWRRDVVLQAGGFSSKAVDPELEMMVRLQQPARGDSRRFVTNEEAFGTAHVLAGRPARARARRDQRAALELLSRRASEVFTLGTGTTAPLFESALLTPLAQLWVVLATITGAALGWFSWLAPVAVVAIIAFGTALVSAAALHVRGSQANAPDRLELKTLLLLAPLEVLLTRPARLVARLSGVVSAGPVPVE